MESTFRREWIRNRRPQFRSPSVAVGSPFPTTHMKTLLRKAGWRPFSVMLFSAMFTLTCAVSRAQSPATNVLILEPENVVEVMSAGSTVWRRARAQQPLFPGDKLRTGLRSRVMLQLSDRSRKRYGPQSLIEVAAPGGPFNFLRGALYYFHRDKPGTLPVRTPHSFAVIRGTEFHLQVDEDETTTLSLFDGEVEMTNEFGRIILHSGEQGIVTPGQPPRKARMPAATPMLAANNIIQWALYYPGVLDVSELPLNDAEQSGLAESLRWYRAGDLPAAQAAYPEERLATASPAEQVYRAALLLTVGETESARALLATLRLAAQTQEPVNRLAASLERLIEAVQNPPLAAQRGKSMANDRALATELLSESYALQAQLDPRAARDAARRAAEVSPQFGFAWERLAELEFSFRRIPQARSALERSLELSPRNAQAHALRGFLSAAVNNMDAAMRSFDEAISIEGSLANAWLGRGLCRIRRGDADGGRGDLETAVALEPQRALLRSYLSKAWSNAGDDSQATNEIRFAKELDANDPTSWLYSALLNEQQNRVNDAVRDFERSRELNDNRQLFRSQLLLDDDEATRRAYLAGIYRDAGMREVSLREAARAVSVDYANYSAHLFLAHSYDALRDPRQIDLRFETAFLSEFLVANLLSPAAVGTLTPQVSQQEYARLFERDRFGLSSSTEYFDNGDWVQSAVQYGSHKDFSYSLEAFYRAENGDRPNDELDQTALTLKLKQQLTRRDSVYFQTTFYDAESGDVSPRSDPNAAVTGLRVEEKQDPLLLAGYHREWSPGQHSLALVGRVPDRLKVRNPKQQTVLFDRFETVETLIRPVIVEEHYESDLDLYTAEFQQIMSHPRGTLIAGGRFQSGGIDTDVQQYRARYDQTNYTYQFINSSQDLSADFARASAYAYDLWQVLDSLQLVAGVSYDWLRYPRNFRLAPVNDDESTTDKVSPKAGFIYAPLKNSVLRGAYTRGLGGVSLDQSFRLEPSQVAGFNQAFRSIIPESVAGATAAATFESTGLSLEQKFGAGTYLGVSGELLNSRVSHDFGVFDLSLGSGPIVPTGSSIRERLNYRERSLLATFNQLIGDEFSIGAVYRLSHAELNDEFPGVRAGSDFPLARDVEATLHQLRLFVVYNHASGLFAQFESVWLSQMNDGYDLSVKDNSFWQHNIFAGYRFAKRRVEMRVGVLNLADEDYRLNPLNLTGRLPRERTFYSSLQFNF
jgi:Tfp pilus assembly protein PilF